MSFGAYKEELRNRPLIIIDDNRPNIALLKQYFQVKQFTDVTTVFDVRTLDINQILSYYRDGIIFLDLNMPYKSGFDILTELAERAEADDIPLPYIIIITAEFGEDLEPISKSMGAQGYLRKPISFSDLEQAIKTAFADQTG